VFGASEFKNGISVSGGSVSTAHGGVYSGDVYSTGRVMANAGGVRVGNGSIIVKHTDEDKHYDPVTSPGTLGTLGANNDTIGWRFRPDFDMVIDRLLWTTASTFDEDNPFHIGIWDDNAEDPIFQTTITDEKKTMDDNWYYKDVETPVLYAFRNYWIAGLVPSSNTFYTSGTPAWDDQVVQDVVMGMGYGNGPVLTKPFSPLENVFGPVSFLCRAMNTTTELKSDGLLRTRNLMLTNNYYCIRGLEDATGITVPNNTDTTVSIWTTTVAESGGMMSSATYIGIPFDGLYYIFYDINWDEAKSGHRNSQIMASGDSHRYCRVNFGPGDPAFVNASEFAVFTQNTNLHVELHQNSGGDVDAMTGLAACRWGVICLHRLP